MPTHHVFNVFNHVAVISSLLDYYKFQIADTTGKMKR